MDTVANMSADERAELFRETGEQMGLSGALVEKDFWVCWTLGHLFEMPRVRDMLMFKGGTSLSKVFGLIDRFSEDIDLAIDYAPLGFIDDRDPVTDMSRTQRTKLLAEMMTACREYIAGPFLDALRDRCAEAIRDTDSWSLAVSDDDLNTVEFAYPSAGLRRVEYVKPRMLLELGTHAELIPSGEYTITPFAAEQFPGVFVRSPVCDTAVKDVELLRKVVEHKTKFYYSAWARYDLAMPSTLALVPLEERRSELVRDYDAMSVMIFGEPPPLEDVLDELARLEAKIHG